MKKTESQTSTIFKKGSTLLNFSFVQSPQLSTTFHTSHYPFECFDDELHVPISPVFSYNNTGRWYLHIPMIIFLTISNRRPQEIHDLSMTLKIYDKKNKIKAFNEAMPDTVVSANGLYTHKFIVTIDEDVTNINLKAECKYRIDNLKFKAKCSDKINVDEPLSVIYRLCGADKDIIQVDVENKMMDEIITNLKLKVGDESPIDLIKKLNYGEKVSGNMPLENSVSKLEVSWDIPGSKNNKKIVNVDYNINIKSIPINVTLETPNRPIKALEPFLIKLILTNITKTPIEGELKFKQSYTPIQLFGVNENSIKSIAPGEKIEIEFCFVALNHGTFRVPTISFNLQKPSEKFEVVPKEVVIVIGNTI